MTGPELDHDLEAIGRRLSPRLGHAHDAVVSRATRGASARRPRPALPRLNRLGGAALTLAFSAGFAALLAVGVASRPASDPQGPRVANGPSVAMATSPGLPAVTSAPSGAAATPAPVDMIAPAPTFSAVSPTHAAGVTSAPTTPASGPTTLMAPASPAPQQTAAATAEPSQAAVPTDPPAPTQTPGPHYAPTAPAKVTSSPTAASAPVRVVLTEKDSGKTITIHPGDVVEVDLSSPQGGSRWTEPQSTDPAVVKRGSGRTRSDGSSMAVFTAGQNGNAQIQASKVPACATATPRCLPPQRIDFQVTIVVTA
jgi:hypothetical protein